MPGQDHLAAASDPRPRHRQHDPSRDGVLSIELLITLLLFVVSEASRRGYRHLLDAFWELLGPPYPETRSRWCSGLCGAGLPITVDGAGQMVFGGL